MKVTSGLYKGRALNAPPGMDVRPTSDKVRQAIFNILAGMGLPRGCTVLDGFCGTGALGIEALSRGAETCMFMDASPQSLRFCEDNIRSIGVTGGHVLKLDVTRPGRASAPPADLLFLDPPYHRQLALVALAALAGNGWLAPSAAGVIETETTAAAALPSGFHLLDRRIYGETCLLFVRYQG